jgi:SAM-dependent methyltransferase
LSDLATNTQDGLRRQREIWRTKPALRLHYAAIYDRLIPWLPEGDVFEIGSGSGNFKDYYPRIISTDVFSQPWIDRELSSESLVDNIGLETAAGFVLIDVLHHISDPIEFLRSAGKALRPGGRIVVCEPYISRLLGRLVFDAMHHEPVDMNDDLTGPRPEFDLDADYANQGIPTLLFDRHTGWLDTVPELALVHVNRFSGPLYMASGGFNYRNMLPLSVHKAGLSIEQAIVGLAPGLLALRILAVLEKRTT